MAPKKKTGLGKGLDALIAPTNEQKPNPQKTQNDSESGKQVKQSSSKNKSRNNERIVEVPVEVEKIVEVPVEVEKIVEVPVEVEKIVEVPVEVEKIVEVIPENGVTTISIDEIEPNKNQPRKIFEDDSLNELSESIKQHGIIQPLIVVKKDDFYEIIAGERRWRAARLAGITEIPVIIKDYSNEQALEIALIENIQREDLNPIEEAEAFKRLIEDYGLKQEELAEKVSKSRTAVTNSMRLLNLDDRIKQMITENLISSGHGRALLPVPDPEVQYSMALKIFDNKLSVRETEKLVKSLLDPNKKTIKKDYQKKEIYHILEDRIKTSIGSKVRINPGSKNKGKIEIEYYSEEDLERIVSLLESVN